MNPIWFYAFGYPVHLYAVMIATGFVVGIWMAARYGERVGLERDMILDLCWWILVSGLVGSRLAFIVVNWDQYYYACTDFALLNQMHPELTALTASDCTRIFRFWTGGLVFYGGVLGAIGTMVWYLRREGVAVLPVADALIPSLAVGQFFGRLGCLAAGCCWGQPTNVPWGVTFPRGSMPHVDHVQQHLIAASEATSLVIHPTQLYDAGAGLLILAALLWIRHHKRWHGQVFVWWLVLYPLARTTIEVFRGDAERGYVFEWVSPGFNAFLGLPAASATFLSTSQFISLGVMAAAGALLWRQRRKLRVAD